MAGRQTRLLTRSEAACIAVTIAALFGQWVQRFDGKKYPDRVYQRLLRRFGTVPLREPEKSIPDALRWKYGYWTKQNFPGRQRLLMERIAQAWPGTPHKTSARQTFDWLHGTQQVSYISAAFLTHLLFPATIPIIDQHNFRAMNSLMNRRSNAVPSRFQDLTELKQFIREVLAAWPTSSGTARPSERDLDKFLMAYGKSIKVRRARVSGSAIGKGARSARPMASKTSGMKARTRGAPTKMDLAKAIYQRLHGQPSAVVRRAFVDEAGLTESGANTYYYKLKT